MSSDRRDRLIASGLLVASAALLVFYARGQLEHTVSGLLSVLYGLS